MVIQTGHMHEMLPSASTTADVGQQPEYSVVEEPLGTGRPVRIITIGAGASGLNIARNVKEHMKNVELQIYEKNDAVGGTWFENSYPGCGCDIPSHNYQYSWEPNPDWKKYYSLQPEILDYFQHAAHKHGLLRYVKLKHRIVEAVWNEEQSFWRFKIEQLETGKVFEDYAHFFINASGYLNNWKWPDIKDLATFKGELLHSAAWKPETNLKDKTVAVIGYGSSGIQLVTAIQPEVKHLTTFVRGPTWITAGFGSKFAAPGGQNFDFPSGQKASFNSDSKEYLSYRKAVEHELCSRFKMLHKDTAEQAAAVRFSTDDMIHRLGPNHPLAQSIIPQFAVGCRRPSPGNGYLEALTQPNVTVITGQEISHAVSDGLILSSGEAITCDVIVCATGFDLSFRPRFPIIGRNATNLAEQWWDRPIAYLSMTPANIPNYFMFLGPNAPVSHGSAIPIIEHLSKYMLKMIYKAQIEGYKSFVPRTDAIKEFIQHADAFLPRMAWSSHCRSWFKNGKETGPVTGLYPGSRIHWFQLLKQPRYEDWEWKTTNRNRWAYMGNGFSTAEVKGGNLTWYFDEPEKEYEDFEY